MRFVWFLPITVLLAAAGIFLRARHRSGEPRTPTSEPVSGQWLAEKRAREEHRW
jgi:cytochrome c-type biogenesis protein CcmH/NrfF